MRSLFPAFACAAVLALTACGGDSTGAGPDGLSRAEAAALSRATLAFGTGAARGDLPGGARGNALPAPGANRLTFSFDTTQPCAAGGSVALAGSSEVAFDAATQAGQLRTDLSVRHQGCVHRGDDGGTLELSGDPQLSFTVTARSGPQGLSEFRVTERGAFTWRRGDGNGGSCTVELVAELLPGAQAVQTTGTFCGFPVDTTFHPR